VLVGALFVLLLHGCVLDAVQIAMQVTIFAAFRDLEQRFPTFTIYQVACRRRNLALVVVVLNNVVQVLLATVQEIYAHLHVQASSTSLTILFLSAQAAPMPLRLIKSLPQSLVHVLILID
jgi:hypothetical protein